MNQKLVKAHKRIKDGRASPGDHERVSRSVQAVGATFPRVVKARVNKPARPQPKESSAWKRRGPLVIVRPLRHIHERHPDLKDMQGNFAGYAPRYEDALDAAQHGDGATVRRLAQFA